MLDNRSVLTPEVFNAWDAMPADNPFRNFDSLECNRKKEVSLIRRGIVLAVVTFLLAGLAYLVYDPANTVPTGIIGIAAVLALCAAVGTSLYSIKYQDKWTYTAMYLMGLSGKLKIAPEKLLGLSGSQIKEVCQSELAKLACLVVLLERFVASKHKDTVEMRREFSLLYAYFVKTWEILPDTGWGFYYERDCD